MHLPSSCRLLVLPLVASLNAQSNAIQVNGRALDPDGRPLAGVTVAQYWDFAGPPRAFGGGSKAPEVYRTDDDGTFSGRFAVTLKACSLLALSADHGLAALVECEPAGPTVDLELRLLPAVRVTGRITCTDLDRPLPWANLYLSSPEHNARFGMCSTREGPFELVLPPGNVRMHAYGTDAADRRWTMEVPAGEPVFALGDVDLQPTFFARHVGKELPPWRVTAARGLDPERCALADLKGRWIYVEFWGWWCGPCVGRGLPEMMKFAAEHAEFADRFLFIAFHDRRAKDFGELDEKLVSIKQQRWGGKDLPFPILLDATGMTLALYGVRSFPTGILIDPDGKLVGEVGLQVLLEKLQGERAAQGGQGVRDG